MATLNLDRIIDSVLGFDTLGIGRIRNIEWGKRYLWDVKFHNALIPPAPFEDYFPAIDITLGAWTIETHNLNYFTNVQKIPKAGNITEMSITFQDDGDSTLFKWFTDWIQLDILNNGEFMSGLEDDHKVVAPDSFGNGDRKVAPVRDLQVIRLNAQRDRQDVYNFKIFPSGSFNFTGGNTSEAVTYTLKFIAVGTTPVQSAGKASQTETLKKLAKNVFGRFL